MAGDYIPLDHDFPEKPEVLSLLRNAQVTDAQQNGNAVATVGDVMLLLFRMWRLFDRQSDDGLLRGLDLSSLSVACGGREAFWHDVAAVGWLIVTPEGLVMPRFRERFRTSAKERMRKSRADKKEHAAQQVRNRRATQGATPLRAALHESCAPEPEPEPPPKSPKGTLGGAPCEFSEFAGYCRELGRGECAAQWWEYQNRVGWQAARDWQAAIRARIKAEPAPPPAPIAQRPRDPTLVHIDELAQLAASKPAAPGFGAALRERLSGKKS